MGEKRGEVNAGPNTAHELCSRAGDTLYRKGSGWSKSDARLIRHHETRHRTQPPGHEPRTRSQPGGSAAGCPPLALLLLIGAGYALGLHRHLSLTALAENRDALRQWVDGNLAPGARRLHAALCGGRGALDPGGGHHEHCRGLPVRLGHQRAGHRHRGGRSGPRPSSRSSRPPSARRWPSARGHWCSGCRGALPRMPSACCCS